MKHWSTSFLNYIVGIELGWYVTSGDILLLKWKETLGMFLTDTNSENFYLLFQN